VDTQTRHALKKDNFALATATSVSWLSGHRSAVLSWGIAAVAVVVVGAAALIYWNIRSSAAEAALGAAMDVYTSPLGQPGAPAAEGVYTTASDRTKAANRQFMDVAHQYGWLPEGAKAHYFAGVTYEDLGQDAQAESELKAAAGSRDQNLSNLAKLAMASLDHQKGQDSEAIALYNELAAKPSVTVPATMAQLDLADLYAETGKQEQARMLWAKVKDADKDGAAGAIAAQKLAPGQ
jgi:predicted negative regulator of RcsB-dependent stress response